MAVTRPHLTRRQAAGGALGARHCAFCLRGLGCYAYSESVIESLGGEPGNSYAHTACLARAKAKATKAAAADKPAP